MLVSMGNLSLDSYVKRGNKAGAAFQPIGRYSNITLCSHQRPLAIPIKYTRALILKIWLFLI